METTTNAISILSDQIYLIRINGEIVGYVDDESKVSIIVNSLALAEIQKIEKPTTKILRQDLEENKEVHISTQSLGKMWNGKLKKIAIIDTVTAPKIKYNGPSA
jgi:hypothetical protein